MSRKDAECADTMEFEWSEPARGVAAMGLKRRIVRRRFLGEGLG